MCYFVPSVRRCPRCWRTSWTACWCGIRWSGPVPLTSWSTPSSCRPALRSAWCPWWNSTASACPAAEAWASLACQSHKHLVPWSNQDWDGCFRRNELYKAIFFYLRMSHWCLKGGELEQKCVWLKCLWVLCSVRSVSSWLTSNLRPQRPGTSLIPQFLECLCSYIEYFIMLSSHFCFFTAAKTYYR